ncbi:Rep [uncultured virus]|uniref:Rep n=1 Tax=uncultured virus TaxID=340016 RepID=A0A2K9LSK3_9VIRU|nr:Rep [uncultured virus]
MSQTVSARGGNTKPPARSRARTFCITLYYHDIDKVECLKNYMVEKGIDCVLGKEICPETQRQHIQGYLEFEYQVSFSTLKKKFPDMHIERCKDKIKGREYCLKDGDIYFDMHPPPVDKFLKNEPKWWQTEILEKIKEEPDDRTINWYYDLVGGCGKTTLAKHIVTKYKRQCIYTGGKAADVKFGVNKFMKEKKNNLRIVIFDYTRSQEQFISYEAIESVKNGIFFSTKFESEMCYFDSPHVFVFANYPPDESKLSKDRWNIVEITEE